MVSLQDMRESNSRIATSLPPGLVAVFVGATSGIGESTLKQLVKRARQPRIYFFGRRETEGKRIQAELKELNQEGDYHYMKLDASLLKNVDEACRYLKDKEPVINILFLSCGTMLSGRQTDEALNYPSSLLYYSRARFIVNLLPHLRQAPSLRRVVTVAAGSKEGPVVPTDWQASNLRGSTFNSHVTSMITLSLEAIAAKAPEVSFVHVFPGYVKTDLSREVTSIRHTITMFMLKPILLLIHVPIDECGERHIFIVTSARFPPRNGGPDDANGVALGEGIDTAVGVDGEVGGGVYSIDYQGEGTSERVQALMKDLTEDGTARKIWEHTEEEFLRITGTKDMAE